MDFWMTVYSNDMYMDETDTVIHESEEKARDYFKTVTDQDTDDWHSDRLFCYRVELIHVTGPGRGTHVEIHTFDR